MSRPAALSWLVGILVFGLAIWARQRGLAASHALMDSMGPYWSALREGVPRPHADPYGWALLLQYWLVTAICERLWDAVRLMAGIHALAAPLTVLVMASFGRKALAAALLGGLAVALDPGLVDTSLSGSKAYLAPIWVGVMVMGWTRREALWAQALIPMAWAFAIMNHPLAVAAWPFLCGINLRMRTARWGLVAAALCLWPQAVGLIDAGGVGLSSMDPVRTAVGAYAAQGGWTSLVFALGPVIALCDKRSRNLGVATIGAVLTLSLLGMGLDYLRDHHLRILTIPAVAGWVGLRGWWPLLGFLCLRVPAHPVQPEGMTTRDDTVGLAHHVTEEILRQVEPPVVVDRAWFEGSPSVEPAAILLDLHLRGWGSDKLDQGGQVVVIVAAERDTVDELGAPGRVLVGGDRFRVASGSLEEVRAWSASLCDREPRLGGAWDGLSVLHPDYTVDTVGSWWDCP